MNAIKRIGRWAFYAIGILSVLYLVLYGYVAITGHHRHAGAPIRIFRKPGAPHYSWLYFAHRPGMRARRVTSDFAARRWTC